MSRIVLYAHGGSGNHGCEAIVRGTARILEGRELLLISSRPGEDRCYGVDKLAEVVLDTDGSIGSRGLDFVKAYAALKLKKDFLPMEKLQYKASFDRIQRGDIALSIGGDNYCYADVYRYTMFHEMAKARGAKTVLWGCSVEPDMVKDPKIARDLANYDLICARETISYEALKAVNPNTVLVSDPAFCLPMQETVLPEGFVPGNTVGINLSPMVMDRESVPGIALENYVRLIRRILDTTDMTVALIPHVVWAGGDDREPLQRLYDAFSDTGRVCMVTDRSCTELKYLISQCRFFLGARTHATIAAYSTGVPTLVLGYSVKARGIARDLLGTEDGNVLPVQSLRTADDLTAAFAALMGREDEIRSHLADILPEYRKKAHNAREILLKKG
jgi:polysaccharide pyruvyl transferase WcaK-like protein